MNKHIKQFLVSASAVLMITGVGASASSSNVSAKRHIRTHRVSSAWHHGIPSVIRGHYASYSYIHGHIRHGERTDINLNRTYASIIPKGAPNPFGLKKVYTKKIGHHKYMISGRVESVEGPSYSGLIVTKTRRGAHIKCTNNKLGTKRLVNGRYYNNRYTHNFRVLNSEV